MFFLTKENCKKKRKRKKNKIKMIEKNKKKRKDFHLIQSPFKEDEELKFIAELSSFPPEYKLNVNIQ